ncbi:MAG: hypothetical protein ACYC3L_11975 [Gemmatimonadaceae bacterium]
MRPSRTVLAAAFALSVASACASAPPAAGRPRYDPALITREQIQEQRFSNAYDAVKALRGNWLNVRGAESFRYPLSIQVYLDDTHVGDISTLSGIASPPIQYIRWYSGQEATAKWGIDHGAGAIYVSTRPPRDGGSATPPPGTER